MVSYIAHYAIFLLAHSGTSEIEHLLHLYLKRPVQQHFNHSICPALSVLHLWHRTSMKSMREKWSVCFIRECCLKKIHFLKGSVLVQQDLSLRASKPHPLSSGSSCLKTESTAEIQIVQQQLSIPELYDIRAKNPAGEKKKKIFSTGKWFLSIWTGTTQHPNSFFSPQR